MRIEIKNLTHIYSPGLPYETKALDDINAVIEEGEFAAVIGSTGSGKSTLIQHINGLLKPSSGQILADGIDVNAKTDEARAIRRRIGLVFQYPEYQLFEETVIKDIMFGPKNAGLSEEEAKERAIEALKLVNLDPETKGDKSPFELSGGEKRRVAIAGILAMDPELLILDEPTAGLDPKGHSDIMEMIESVRVNRKISIIIVSHNMDDVARFAKHILVMNRGRLMMDAGPEEIFSDEEKLKEYGLSLPQSTAFMKRLKALGKDVDINVLTAAQAADEIFRKFS